MNTQGFPLVIARILLALMFVMSGFSKLTGLEGTAGYIASVGLPAAQLLALGAGVLEVVAGVMLIVGFQARWAALALAAFTVIASVLFHNFCRGRALTPRQIGGEVRLRRCHTRKGDESQIRRRHP